MPRNEEQIERLIDAIELIKANERDQARAILRGLIGEDTDFEDAWLWMSLAVDSLDQSEICLDNVLRINPKNPFASQALYWLQESERVAEKQRERYRFIRDSAQTVFWVLVVFVLFAVLFTQGIRYGLIPL